MRRDTSVSARRGSSRRKSRTYTPSAVRGPKASAVSVKKKRRGMSPDSFEFVYKLLLAVAFFGILAFVSTQYFRVRTIEVRGNEVCHAMQVADASGVKYGDKLLFVNRADIARGIFDKLPYADTVRIHRKLPGTLIIELTECVPAATVVTGNVAYIVDKDCKLLEYGPYSPAIARGVVVTGMKVLEYTPGKPIVLEDDLRLSTLRTLIATFSQSPLLEGIGEIDAVRLYDIRFPYKDRLTISLGSAESLERKLEMLEEVVKRLDSTKRGLIDLSDVGKARFIQDG